MDQAFQFMTAEALAGSPARVIPFQPATTVPEPIRRPRVQAEAAAPSARTRGGRITEIDLARGLFVLWMVVAHALFLAGVRRTSPLAALIPPPGAFSDSFVILSGFTIAWVFAARVLRDQTGAWLLRRRGLQVGFIAWLSNLASHMLVEASTGTLSPQVVADTVLLRREWSLSWILVPTAALLLVSPWLVRLAHRAGATGFVAMTSLAGLAVFGPLRAPLGEWTTSLTAAGVHFPLMRLVTGVTLGAWGLSVAFWARRFSLGRFAAGFAGVSIAALLIGQANPLPPLVDAGARFGVFFGGALGLALLPVPPMVPTTLRLLGRNALLVFVAHRLYLQVQVHTVAPLVSPQAAGAVMTAVAIALLLATCRAREAHPVISGALKRAGL